MVPTFFLKQQLAFRLFALFLFTCSLSLLPIIGQAQVQQNEQPSVPALKPATPLADPEAEATQYKATLPPKPDLSNEENVYSGADALPDPGFDLAAYLSKNINYPKEDLQKGIQGRVVIKFIVSRTGVIRDAFVSESLSPACDAEALRVVQAMPTWKSPAILNGKSIPVHYTLPVAFYLRKSR